MRVRVLEAEDRLQFVDSDDIGGVHVSNAAVPSGGQQHPAGLRRLLRQWFPQA
jgi:hypothetical protein